MAYRHDPDLTFLRYADNEDLEILVNYLTKDKNGNARITEWLTFTDEYKQYYPDHKKYWERIAETLQRYGGNTIANVFRGGKGTTYKTILLDVCKKLKVKTSDSSRVDEMEMNLIMKIFEDSLKGMSEQELLEVIKVLKIEDDVSSIGSKSFKPSPRLIVKIMQKAVKAGGFQSYQLTLIVANAVARILLGRGLSLTANAALTRSLSLFAGPIGITITGIWTIIDLAGPAYRVTIPAVIQVSLMRAKLNYSNTSGKRD